MRENKLLFEKIILIFGKSGAGKSSVGEHLASMIGGRCISMGDFIREQLATNPPVKKSSAGKFIFLKLAHHLKYINEKKKYKYCILVCNPHPQDCFDGLLNFIKNYSKGCLCFEIFVNNRVALLRMEKRSRREKRGYDYTQRLKYYKKSIKPAILKFDKVYKVKRVNNYKSIKSTAKEIRNILKDFLI